MRLPLFALTLHLFRMRLKFAFPNPMWALKDKVLRLRLPELTKKTLLDKHGLPFTSKIKEKAKSGTSAALKNAVPTHPNEQPSRTRTLYGLETFGFQAIQGD